jgi:hypothetical protein
MHLSRQKARLDRPASALAVTLAVAALAGWLAAAAGCSESSTDSPDARAADAQQPAEDSAAPTATDAAPFTGRCGRHLCRPSGVDTPGCCTEPGTGEAGDPLENTGRAPDLCGTDVGEFIPPLAGICLQLDQPGEVDDECPAQEPIGGGVRMPGCCTDEGHCGSREDLVGFGCFYATGLKGRDCIPGPDSVRPRVDADADAGS